LGSDDAAWHSGNSRGIVRFVGRKDPNTLGLYDMFGNVHEFVDGQGVTIDGNGYVYRGGAYNSNIGSCNAESRNAFYYYSSSSSSNVGFRLASDTRP
jgi:formylglycine-generating enzyme required for sulfatase activity